VPGSGFNIFWPNCLPAGLSSSRCGTLRCPGRTRRPGRCFGSVPAHVHETLAKPEAGLHPAVLIAAAAGIEAHVPVETVMVVAVAMMMVAMMAVFSAVLASQSGAGSKQNKSGGDTKSSLAEQRCSPVNPARAGISRARFGNGSLGTEDVVPLSFRPQVGEGAAGRRWACLEPAWCPLGACLEPTWRSLGSGASRCDGFRSAIHQLQLCS
jgi:hypothetical protein